MNSPHRICASTLFAWPLLPTWPWSVQGVSFRSYRTPVLFPKKRPSNKRNLASWKRSASWTRWSVLQPFVACRVPFHVGPQVFEMIPAVRVCLFLSYPASFSSANRFLYNERCGMIGECFSPAWFQTYPEDALCWRWKISRTLSIKKVSNSFLSKGPLPNPSNEKNLTIQKIFSIPYSSCLKSSIPSSNPPMARSPEIVKSRLHIIHEAIMFFSSFCHLTDGQNPPVPRGQSTLKIMGYSLEV